MWLGDDEDDLKSEEISLTWYDARCNHPIRSEYRLYFQSSDLFENVSENDLLIIGKKTDGTLLVLLVKNKSTFENQILWLLGLNTIQSNKFELKIINKQPEYELSYIKNTLLPLLQIESDLYDENLLDEMINRFDNKYPTTRDFSNFSKSTISKLDYLLNPDEALISLMEKEEILFKTYEKYFVEKKLAKGFGNSGTNVDDFIKFSLSVQNRRKSRVGYALENHLEDIFKENKILYTRGKITEHRSKPDFIFPSIVEYQNANIENNKITMLGVKTTCKDRWRQVLAEAEKVEQKHLLTLQPGISTSQTNEMISKKLQLIVPKSINNTYTEEQQRWLINLKDFIDLVKDREKTFNKHP